jgi:hypothetical protein
VTVSAPATSGISFVASSSATSAAAGPSLKLPTGINAGDTLVLYGTVAGGQGAVTTPPAGWTQVKENGVVGGAIDAVVWTKTATAADSGATVKMTLSGATHSALSVAAYRGAGALTASNVTAGSDAGTSTSHVSPTVTATPGSWLLSYWADKTSSTTASNWTEPSGVTKREEAITTGGGRITSLMGDSNAGVPSGNAGGLNATTDFATKGVSWSIVLPSAG